MTRRSALFLALLLTLSAVPVGGNAAEEILAPTNRSDSEISQRADTDDPAAVRSREELTDPQDPQRALPPEEMPSASEESVENADKEGSEAPHMGGSH